MRQHLSTAARPTARTRAAYAVVAGLAALALTACSSSSQVAGPSSSTPSSTASESSGSASPSPSGSASPSSSPTKAGKPTPPAVDRGSASVPDEQKASAKPVPYKSPAEYSDGLSLEVTGTRQWIVTETGAGALTGKPATSFRLTLKNGTGKKLDLNNVVVGVVYGAGNEVAQPVYSDAELFDFNGVLAPGKSAKAIYAFSIPVKDLGSTTLFVDIDGYHTVATFTGSAKS